MISDPSKKYRPFPPIDLPDRQWPARTLTKAPQWCSVDLRDGNQALAIPMDVPRKLELFETLVKIGFKEIEVGFPSASQTEYEFMRRLIEENRIPDDVSIQVLTQAREDLIDRTVQSLKGAKKAIIHLYNSTSPAQRKIVFGLEKADIVKIAVQGTRFVKERLGELAGTDVTFQYSPESFSATEVDFALEVCEAVMDVWQPTPEKKMILNLPDTVEVAMPNVHADQIEWFIRHMKPANRAAAIISLHTHNDRGTGVAATELGLLAGAQRVEGTLFGNGERTGNLDIVTVALNLYMQGIDPRLDLGNLPEVREVYERCTRMEVPPRHPYSGDLVFTAFSGSHQDAINKGMKLQREQKFQGFWDVPYLTLDPKDIGREYAEIIRINSQSGKGGVAYVLEAEFGLALPKLMHREFGPIANDTADRLQREITPQEIHDLFHQVYLAQPQGRHRLAEFFAETDRATGETRCEAVVEIDGQKKSVAARGNGPIAAFIAALPQAGLPAVELTHYSEHAVGQGAKAEAIAYIELKVGTRKFFGAGRSTSIEQASIKAIVSALNRALP
ncbi:MAG: 2-isopropylmalate synthase [Verrucomicrobium sp.]|nr:2-isopropylmalate synthase [Verrucomicrobium sp.]